MPVFLRGVLRGGKRRDGKNKGFVGRDLEVGGIEAESGN